jgi:hypothetical protein
MSELERDPPENYTVRTLLIEEIAEWLEREDAWRADLPDTAADVDATSVVAGACATTRAHDGPDGQRVTNRDAVAQRDRSRALSDGIFRTV